MITNKLVIYGCVVQAGKEKLLIGCTCYMLVEFLNTKGKTKKIMDLV